MSGARTGRLPVVRTLPGPGVYMCGLGYGGGRLWHSDQDLLRIYELDPADGAVLGSVECAQVRADLFWHGGLVYQVGGRPKRLVLVDPATGEQAGEKPVLPSSGRLTGAELGPEGVWLILRAPTVVQLRDLETMTVQAEYPVPGGPAGLTYAKGFVIYGDFETGLLRAFDPSQGEVVAEGFVEGRPTGLAWDGELLWYCDFATRTVRAVRLEDLLGGGT